jgi:hypothetical protein
VKFAAGIAVIAVAFSAAIYIHQRHIVTFGNQNEDLGRGTYGAPLIAPRHPSWEDPVAVMIALGGVAVAVGIVTNRPRFANRS